MQAKKNVRRIVTARTGSGRSYVIEDGQVEEASLGNFNLWQVSPQSPDSPGLAAAAQFPFVPAAGGSLVRVFRLPPEPGNASPEDRARMSAEFGATIGLPGSQPDTSRHPFMHVTPTTDYLMLLSGEVSLLLDEGDPIALRPFDVVIQRGTNHAWINTGSADAFLLSVMISLARPADEHKSKT